MKIQNFDFVKLNKILKFEFQSFLSHMSVNSWFWTRERNTLQRRLQLLGSFSPIQSLFHIIFIMLYRLSTDSGQPLSFRYSFSHVGADMSGSVSEHATANYPLISLIVLFRISNLQYKSFLRDGAKHANGSEAFTSMVKIHNTSS